MARDKRSRRGARSQTRAQAGNRLGDDAGRILTEALRARRSRLRRGRGRRRRLGVALVAMVVLVAVVAGAGLTGRALLTDCSLANLHPVSRGENSFLYAADGSLMGAIPSSTNRQPLPLWRLSRWLPKA